MCPFRTQNKFGDKSMEIKIDDEYEELLKKLEESTGIKPKTLIEDLIAEAYNEEFPNL